MILDGQVLGLPLVSYKDTKSAVEALSGVIAGMSAYSTDSAEYGYYTGATWVWLTNSSGSSVPIVHDIAGAYHSTSGRTTGQVLQATGATAFGWSTNTLTLTGSLTVGGTSSINGTAIVGTPGTLTVSTTNAAAEPHTHAITTSTVGAVSTIMATDANGYARAVRFGAGLATSPTLPLHVGGGGGAPVTSGTTQTYGQIRVQNGDGALDIGQYANGDTWLQNCAPSSLGTSRNIILNPNGGRIGVGTASPSYQVHLYQNADTSSNSIWIQNASTGTAAISSLLIGQTLAGNKYGQWFATGTNYTSGLKALPALGMAFFTSTGMTGGMSFINYANAPIHFSTQGADISVIRLTISGAGNIGAGTVMEGAGVTYQKLNVNGSQLFVGTTSIQEREMSSIVPSWSTSTDATRKARIVGNIYDTAARQWLQVDTDGVASTTTITASQAGAYATTAIDLTLTTAHHWVTVTAAKTITLPAASGCTGRVYIITALVDGVIIDASASELINGELTQTLLQYDTAQLRCNGVGWYAT